MWSHSWRKSIGHCRVMVRLCTDIAHYGVPTLMWVKMSAKQWHEVVSMFDKAKLPNRATTPDTGLERSDQRARSSNPVPDSYTLRPGLAFSTPAPQNYSLTPGPSTPGLVLPIPDNPSFCPVSNKSGSGGISQAPLLQFSTSICFTQCTDVTSSTWMWKYFHATSSCWTRMCCALHCDQSWTEYTCNSWKIICICCWTTTFN